MKRKIGHVVFNLLTWKDLTGGNYCCKFWLENPKIYSVITLLNLFTWQKKVPLN